MCNHCQPVRKHANAVSPWTSTCLAELEPPLARILDAATRGHVVAQGLQNGPLFRTRICQLDEGLEDLIEQRVALKSAGVEIVVYLDLIPGAPEMHELVYLVDKRYRAAPWHINAQISAPAPVPRLQLDLCAA